MSRITTLNCLASGGRPASSSCIGKPAHEVGPRGHWDANAAAEREEEEGAGVGQEALFGISFGELRHERGRVAGRGCRDEQREEPWWGVAAQAGDEETEEGVCEVGQAVAEEEAGHGEERLRGVSEEALSGGGDEEDAEEGQERERRDGERVAAEEGEEVRGGEVREEAEERRRRGGREQRGVDGECERDLGRGDEERVGLAWGRHRESRRRRGVPWGRNRW
nr:unnamed protein product [Digitaria exilis]